GPRQLTASACRRPSPTLRGCRSQPVAPTSSCASWCSWTSKTSTARSRSSRACSPGGTLCVGILHPIITSGLFVRGDEYRTFYMGEYLKTMRHVLDVERRRGGVFHLRVEHRPIERYFRAFEAAGLAVTALREPRPSDELAAADPEFVNTQRVPN